MAKGYGVYDDSIGESRRALFVIDGAGVVRWELRLPVDVNPGADEV